MVNYKLDTRRSSLSRHSFAANLAVLLSDRRIQALIPWAFPIFILIVWQLLSLRLE
jgi:hypothetical protein